MPKLAVGDVVKVVFLDHAENSNDVMRFVVFGEITDITRRGYIIHSWKYADPIDQAADNNLKENENSVAIVKKAIESIGLMKCVKPSKR